VENRELAGELDLGPWVLSDCNGSQLEGRKLETFFNTAVEDYVENTATHEVSTPLHNICTGCTQESAVAKNLLEGKRMKLPSAHLRVARRARGAIAN